MRHIRSVGLSVGFALIAATPVAAQSTWSGNGGNGLWSNGGPTGNWSGALPPASGTTTSIIFAGNGQLATTNDLSPNPFLLNSLTFDATAGAFSIAGNELRFSGTNPTLTQNSGSPISISAPISFDSSGTIGGGGAGSLTLGNLTVRNGTLSVNRNVTVGSLTLGIDGGTAVTVNTGTNVLTLGGDVTFVQLTGSVNTPPATINGIINLGGANRTFSGIFSNAPAPYIDMAINATITGTGGFIHGGSVDQNRSWISLNAANTYTGPTILESGSQYLFAAVDNAIPAGSALTVAGASFDEFSGIILLPDIDVDTPGRGTSLSIGSLSDGGSSFGEIHLGSATASTSVLTIGSDNTSTTYSGLITQGGRIVKVGTGTLTLTGINDYTGGTTINGGTILVNGQTGANSGLGTGQVTVNVGGTLGGNGQALAPITLRGRIQGGDGTTAAGNPTLTTGAVTFENGATMRVAVGGATPATAVNSRISTGTSAFNSTTASDVMAIHLFNDGTLDLSGSATYTLTLAMFGATNTNAVNYSVLADNFGFNGVPSVNVSGTTLSISFVPVPEPASVLCLGVALFGGLAARRRLAYRKG